MSWIPPTVWQNVPGSVPDSFRGDSDNKRIRLPHGRRIHSIRPLAEHGVIDGAAVVLPVSGVNSNG
jgi:hypothetical protein